MYVGACVGVVLPQIVMDPFCCDEIVAESVKFARIFHLVRSIIEKGRLVDFWWIFSKADIPNVTLFLHLCFFLTFFSTFKRTNSILNIML